MPSSRVLASDLGVSRGVVLEAYAQLAAEGFLRSRPGSATTVAVVPGIPRRDVMESGRHGRAIDSALDLRPGAPDLSSFPRRQWLTAMRRTLSTLPAAALGYAEPWGVPGLRQELADYLSRVRGAMVTAESLVAVTGATQGVSLLAQLLVRHGQDAIAVEDPSNAIQQRLLSDMGLRVVGVPVDEHGLRVDLLARTAARAVIVTPAHQYPTGSSLSADRREQLVRWARAVDGLVIEDDYDSEFRYGRRPIGCLQSLDPNHVAMIGSISKSLAPALRIGWVASPPALVAALRRAKSHADFGSASLDQYVLADFLASGEYDRNLRALRRRYGQRREALLQVLERYLPRWQVMGVAGGLHLVVRLPDDVSESGLVAAAEDQGVLVLGVETMRVEHPYGPALVLSFARATADMLDEAVRRLALAAHDLAAAPRPGWTEPLSGVDWYERLG
jgi:GntR family transcriptional regulator/MocR family aminotransferase